MNIKDFKVGQTVWVELTGDTSRGKTAEQCIEEWEITSVGRSKPKNLSIEQLKRIKEILEEVKICE